MKIRIQDVSRREQKTTMTNTMSHEVLSQTTDMEAIVILLEGLLWMHMARLAVLNLPDMEEALTPNHNLKCRERCNMRTHTRQ
jgi:hypothetical protein